MRYAQRGGYTPPEQQRRGRLRLEAAGRFARGEAISEIAHDLRMTQRPAAAGAPAPSRRSRVSQIDFLRVRSLSSAVLTHPCLPVCEPSVTITLLQSGCLGSGW